MVVSGPHFWHHVRDFGAVPRELLGPCSPTAPLAPIASVLIVEQDAHHDEVLGERLDIDLLVDRPDPGHPSTILASSPASALFDAIELLPNVRPEIGGVHVGV